MIRAALILLMAWAACAQTCTINGFPLTIINGQVACPATPTPVPIPTPAPSACSTTFCDPTSVLVIMEDNTGPETGTNGVNGGLYVAQHYMQARGIPAANLVHIATSNIELRNGGPGCKPGQDCDLTHSDSTNLSLSLYQTQVLPAITAALNGPLKGKIHYVVPIYGVPTHIIAPSGVTAFDSAISALLQTNPTVVQGNPYKGSQSHINGDTTNILLVSRLDGPSAVAAAALVDKAIAGEAGIHGVGYFDYGPNAPLGSSSLNAYQSCTAVVPAQTCTLNDQSMSGHMIQSAPNTAWAWGGYDLSASNAGVYSFVPGAVATQMNSNSANCIRSMCPGSYAAAFLAKGVTATWGAVSEPYTAGYAQGDVLLGAMWKGFTFGEAAYIANPLLNWEMEFVGDPLYRPLLK